MYIDEASTSAAAMENKMQSFVSPATALSGGRRPAPFELYDLVLIPQDVLRGDRGWTYVSHLIRSPLLI
jgi:hypothetical protein